MKPIYAAGLLWLIFCTPTIAQQASPEVPATREDVEKYFQIVHSREQVLRTIDTLSAPIQKMFELNKDKLPSDYVAQMHQQLEATLRNLPWDDILQAMIPAYEKHFSKSDLEALTAFYSTPSGQKILSEMPSATAEAMSNAMPLLQNYMQGVTRRLQGEMEAKLRETDKASANNPSVKH